MPDSSVIIILALIIVIIIVIIIASRSRDSADKDLYRADNDGDYRNYIYKNVSISAKPYINQIFNSVDKINHMVEQYNSSYDQARYDAMKSILGAANQAEEQIRRCWNSAQFNKDFSFYIGLHYASHLLGMAIKSEQSKIRDTFVIYKNKRERESRHIDELKRLQEKSSYSSKADIGKEIAAHCKFHKQLSNLTSQIGEINSNYLKRLTEQNIETAKRRDYIASHFGTRGRNWKKRIRMRALLRNN